MKTTSATVALLMSLLLPLHGLDAAPAKAAPTKAERVPPKNTSTLGTSVLALPSRLQPGEYLWVPEVSPRGPIVLIVSLPEQRAYVYRNGVLIGASTVSTGKKGYETPTGVFTILQKNVDHYSNLYNDAPMPYMQRLTWSGVALHAGRLPGYPASHGCVRMPYEFARKLYAETRTGLTVVVSDNEQFPVTVANPGLVAPVDPKGALVSDPPLVTDSDTVWRPEAAPEGPVTILLTVEDRRISVFRNGIEIGRERFGLKEPERQIRFHVLTMLEPSAVGPLDPVTGQPLPRWLMISGQQEDVVSTDQLLRVFDVPTPFLRQLQAVVGPGTTLVVTRPAASGATTTTPATDFTVVAAEEPVAK